VSAAIRGRGRLLPFVGGFCSLVLDFPCTSRFLVDFSGKSKLFTGASRENPRPILECNANAASAPKKSRCGVCAALGVQTTMQVCVSADID
jgi:hypothetical protein